MNSHSRQAQRPAAFLRVAVLGIALLSSCVRAYHPESPPVPVVISWKTPLADKASTSCPNANENGIVPWWNIYNDPVLTALVEEALSNNLSILLQIAVVEQARATVQQAAAPLYPQIDLTPNAIRQRYPANTNNPTFAASTTSSSTSTTTTSNSTTQSAPMPLPPVPTLPTITNTQSKTTSTTPTTTTSVSRVNFKQIQNTIQVPLNLSYEVDLWGSVRQARDSADASYQASEENLLEVQLVTASDVAANYFQLRALDAELVVLQDTVTSLQQAADINEARFKAGIDNELDYATALYILAKTQATYEDVRRQRGLLVNAISQLVGKPASLFSISAEPNTSPLPDIPPCFPLDLLQLRPDIREQERLLEAFRLQVGVAKAAFFPSLLIGAGYGFQATTWNQLFKWKDRIWNIMADISQPIFTGGLLTANEEIAKAQYRQQLQNFIDRVLTAYREVEDALTDIEDFKRQMVYVENAVEASRKRESLAFLRYDRGLVDYLDVVTAEQDYLDAQRLQAQVRGAQFISTVNLIKALGGVWNDEAYETFDS